MAQLLLQHGADANAVNGKPHPPHPLRHVRHTTGCLFSLSLLCADDGDTPLHIVKSYKIMRLLLTEGDGDHKKMNGQKV